MYYNPETERALRNIDQMSRENWAAAGRRNAGNAVPLVSELPKVWSPSEGRWVFNPSYQNNNGTH